MSICRLFVFLLVVTPLTLPARAAVALTELPDRVGPFTTDRPASTVSAALPLSFEPNVGQTDPRVRYVARGSGYAVFITDEGATLSMATRQPGMSEPVIAGKRDRRLSPDSGPFEAAAIQWCIEGQSDSCSVEVENPLPGTANYMLGADREQWHQGIQTFGQVRFAGAYEGIDAVLYGTDGRLEYDFVVAPDADPSQIRVRFEGQTSISIDESGDVCLDVGGGIVRQIRPLAYEVDGSSTSPVPVRAELDGAGGLSFAVSSRTPGRSLVIDPVLVFEDFLGGSVSVDRAVDAAESGDGAIYVAGETMSLDFPTFNGGDNTFGGETDVFVASVNRFTHQVAVRTYLGGAGRDLVGGMTFAPINAEPLYLVGTTYASPVGEGFPVTAGAFDTTLDGQCDAFVVKFTDFLGGIAYSTLLGGDESDFGNGIVVDASGSAYVTGSTSGGEFAEPFPTTAGAFDPTFNGFYDAFVTKLSPTGSSLEYSTFLGGGDLDEGASLCFGTGTDVYVSGRTINEEFPTTAGAFDTTFNGSPDFDDAYLVHLNSAGSALLYGTFLGGTGSDNGTSVAIDSLGQCVVTGSTDSTDFPTTAGVLQPALAGGRDAFVAKFAVTGNSLVFSTYFGGSGDETTAAIGIDAVSTNHICGTTSSADLPTSFSAFDRTFNGGGSDAFAARLAFNGASLSASTFIGTTGTDFGLGMYVPIDGRAFVVGQSGSITFPATGGGHGALDGADAFYAWLQGGYGSMLESGTFAGQIPSGAVSSTDDAVGVAVDASGSTTVVGTTTNANFPTSVEAFDRPYASGMDIFVTKLSPDGQTVVFSAIIGGEGDDEGVDVAVDASGAVSVVGTSTSIDYPTTPGAFDSSRGSILDTVVTSLSADGKIATYSTYLGGDLGVDTPTGIAVEPGGAAIVAGFTDAADFPVTTGAADETFGGATDAFVARFSTTGNLEFATFLGDDQHDRATDVDVDASGAAVIMGTTTSPMFPITGGALDSTFAPSVINAFLAKLTLTGSSLSFSTFVGDGPTLIADGMGLAPDGVASLVISNLGRPAGGIAPLSLQRVSSNGSQRLSMFEPAEVTQVGVSRSVHVTALGETYVSGTLAGGALPVTPGAFQTVPPGSFDGFVMKIGPTGDQLEYCSYVGGSGLDFVRALAVDAAGRCYVVGVTWSPDFAETGFGIRHDSSAFVACLNLPVRSGAQTPGVYVPASGAWFLRNSNSPGPADVVFGYGPAGVGLVPVIGDWDGDGAESPGLYDPSTGAFFLKNTLGPGAADIVFSFGAGGLGLQPLSGDWNADGVDTIGLYSPTSAAFFLRDVNAGGPADVVFTFGASGLGAHPIVGDWNGDGMDSVGLYIPSSATFFLRNDNSPGPADVAVGYGPLGVDPVVGDWDGDGVSTVGVYSSATGAWFLRNRNDPGGATNVFTYGPGGVVPIVGDWDGQ